MTLALLAGPEAARAQQAGSLDPSFGSGGRVTTDFAKKKDLAQGVVVQSDGKVVAAGWATVGGTYRFGVARYNADGSLDSSFGTGGKVTTVFGGVEDTASGVALQSDGKIVVVGTTDVDGNLNYQFAVARYNTDGSLDNTFSGDGKATISGFIGTYNAGHAVAVQPDGAIVIAGFAGNSFAGLNDGRFGVARLTMIGELDGTFGNIGDGKSVADFGEVFSNATSVALQSDGKIVVAGSTGLGGAGADFALARFTANGYLDPTFGENTDGMVITNFGGDDFGQSVALDGSGNIIVAGQAGVSNGVGTFGLARYTSGGLLDTLFGAGGKVTTDFLGYGSYALGAVVDAADRIVAVGFAQGRRSRDTVFAVARLTNTGGLDTSFGSGGKVTTSFSSASDVASAVALNGISGDIVVAGSTQDKNFALARYLD